MIGLTTSGCAFVRAHRTVRAQEESVVAGVSGTRGSGRVTRQDVARYARVSTAVVSYTLNAGPKRVSPELQARVLEAVRVLGYRPNAAARALTSGSARMLGLLVPDIRNPFFAELCHVAESVAEQHGRALLIVSAQGDFSPSEVVRHLDRLVSRQVDGLLIASFVSSAETMAVTRSHIPTVLLDQFGAAEGLSTIGVDFEEGARSGVEHLLGHGHERVAFIGGGNPLDRREAGWLEALLEAGRKAGPRIHVGFSPAEGYRAGRQLLAQEPRTTAVFVSSDYQTAGVLRACREAGRSVPDDIAVVSFDDSSGAQYCWPALSTVRQPVPEMVADAITQLIDPAAWSSTFRAYPATLVVRQSCGCPLTDQFRDPTNDSTAAPDPGEAPEQGAPE